MRNQILVALVILLGVAMAWNAQPALRAAQPNPPVTTPAPPPALTDPQKEAARLSEVTGFTWQASSRERAPGVGPGLLSAGTSAWHGTAVPYIVLPFGLDDDGKAKLALYRENSNASLDIVSADAQRILLAGPAREPDLTAKILAALNMQESQESAQSHLSHARADWLDFRLAVANASDKDAKLPTPLENGPTPAQIDDYARLLADKGPNGGRNRGDPFLWYHPLAFCDLPSSLVTADHWKAPYVLLSNRPEQVMLNASARPRPWHLKRVYTATDAQNQPAVAMEFDDAAAKLLGALTESNIGRPLAVLFHNQLLAVVKIDTKITNKLLISGGKLDKTLADRIVRSLSECMLEENETSRP